MSHFPAMQTVWPPENDSIFGDTHGGVPNPNVPHVHPWPTRYHGPNWTVPGVSHDSYAARPYARKPYVGMGRAPLFDAVTGSSWVDAALGAAIGYVMIPKPADKPAWVVIGAIAGYAAGLVGLGATGAAAYYLGRKQS